MARLDINQYHLEYPEPGRVLAPGWHPLRGWLLPAMDRPVSDIRVRCQGRVFPGIYGFPRADLARHFNLSAHQQLAEFVVQVPLAEGTAEVEFESLDLIDGSWSCFYRTTIAVAAGGAAPGRPLLDAPQQPVVLRRFINRLLQLSQDHPTRSLGELAGELREGLPRPWRLRDAHEPFVGVLDDPVALSPAHYGRFTVLGWLFHRSEIIRRVWATADLQALHELEYGGPAPAIAERFPDVPHSARSGIFGFVDIPLHLAEPICVRVYAELADGSLHLCMVNRSVPLMETIRKRPFPPLSQRLHQQIVAATRGCGIATPDPRDWSSEAAAAWREYSRFAPPRSTGLRHAVPGAATVDAGKPGHATLVSHNLNHEGASLFLLEYARHLAAAGWTLTIITAREGPLRSRFAELGARVVCVDVQPLTIARSAREVRRALKALARDVPMTKTDLVLANTLACHWAILLGRAGGKPTALYLHESSPPPMFFRDQSQAFLNSVRKAFAAATRVGFLTPASRQVFDTWSGHENFQLIGSWIDLAAIDAFRAGHQRNVLRQELGLAAEDRLVVSVGTVCDRKGQHILARAADILARQDPEAALRTPCWLVGGRDTAYSASLQAFIGQLQHPRLRIIEETADVLRYYAAADLFVCTSFEESFPRVVMEAMAFQLPIISTDVHGIPDIVRHGVEAWLVPPGDAPALAKAMRTLLCDREAAAALAAAGRARVENRFRIEAAMPGHLELASALARGPA